MFKGYSTLVRVRNEDIRRDTELGRYKSNTKDSQRNIQTEWMEADYHSSAEDATNKMGIEMPGNPRKDGNNSLYEIKTINDSLFCLFH